MVTRQTVLLECINAQVGESGEPDGKDDAVVSLFLRAVISGIGRQNAAAQAHPDAVHPVLDVAALLLNTTLFEFVASEERESPPTAGIDG